MKLLNLKAKLFISFGIILIFFLAALITGYISLGANHRFLLEMYNEQYTASITVSSLHAKLNNVRASLLTMMSETERPKQEAQHGVIKKLTNEIDESFNTLLTSEDLKSNTVSILKEAYSNWAAFRDTRDNELIPAIYAGRLDKARELALGIQKERYNKFVALTDQLLDIERKEAREHIEALQRQYNRLIFIYIIIGLLSVSASISLALLLNRSIAFPVMAMVNIARNIAQGDLRQQLNLKAKDEIGILSKNLDQMTLNLKEMIDKIKKTSASITEAMVRIDIEKLANGSVTQADSVEEITTSIVEMNHSIKNISGATEDLSQSADKSSASVMEMTAAINEIAQSADNLNNVVEDTASFIAEMSASVKQIDENADMLSSSADETASAISEIAATIKGIEENVNESTRLSEEVKKEATELGVKAVEKTVEGMSGIKESTEALGDIINRLGERSKQIGKVLTVIEDVTDQTNLLALNAAIIAAQSGEHGRGFAVVADEIKGLAERTMSSTKEIVQMIDAIKNEVEEAVKSMKKSSEKVVEGINLSKGAANALNKILESADKSASKVREIELATKEQGRGVVLVNVEVQKITNMVRQIATATQEQRKGSEQIMGAVERMKNVSQQVRQATVEQTTGSKQINDAVENVNQKLHAIVKATKEQSIGSEQIVTSAEKIRAITQENIMSFSEIREQIDLLIKQAELLKGDVVRFVV